MSGRSDSRSETPRSENQPDDGDKQQQQQQQQEAWPNVSKPETGGWSGPTSAPPPTQQQQQPPTQPPQVAPQGGPQAEALKSWELRVNQDGKSWTGGEPGNRPPPPAAGSWGSHPPPPQQPQEDWGQQPSGGGGWGGQPQKKPPQQNWGGAPQQQQPPTRAPQNNGTQGWGNNSGWSGDKPSGQGGDPGGWNNGGSGGWNQPPAPAPQQHEYQPANEPPQRQAQPPPPPQQSSWNQGPNNDPTTPTSIQGDRNFYNPGRVEPRGEHDQPQPGPDKAHANYGENSSLDEATQKKVNANEGWGTTPIQQNTKWNVEESIPDSRTRIHSQSNGTEWWSQDGQPQMQQITKHQDKRPVPRERENVHWGNRPPVVPSQPSDWQQPSNQQWSNQRYNPGMMEPPPHQPQWDRPPGPGSQQQQPSRGGGGGYPPNNRAPNQYRPNFQPGERRMKQHQPQVHPRTGNRFDHQGGWDHTQHEHWVGQDQHDPNGWDNRRQHQQGWKKNPNDWDKDGWGQQKPWPNQDGGWSMPAKDQWPPSWESQQGRYPDQQGFNHNFNQNLNYLKQAAMLQLIPQHLINDPSSVNNQNLLQLCKAVIFEKDKQHRLHNDLNNEHSKMGYMGGGNQREMARIQNELNRSQSTESHMRDKLRYCVGSIERGGGGGGRQNSRPPFQTERKPPGDEFGWPADNQIDDHLSKNFEKKMTVSTTDDGGPPAFEPGKPWPGGSNNLDPDRMNPAKNRDLTPAEYEEIQREMQRQRGNNVRQPSWAPPQQFPPNSYQPDWQSQQPPQHPGQGAYGWGEQERPSPSNPTKTTDFNAKLPNDLLNHISSGDN